MCYISFPSPGYSEFAEKSGQSSMMASNEPEIGDMDEGVVERSEYAGDTEDVFTCTEMSGQLPMSLWENGASHRPSRT